MPLKGEGSLTEISHGHDSGSGSQCHLFAITDLSDSNPYPSIISHLKSLYFPNNSVNLQLNSLGLLQVGGMLLQIES